MFDSVSVLSSLIAHKRNKLSRLWIMKLGVFSIVNSGKYPGDVVPCELLEVSGTKRDGVEPKQLMNEIETAVDGVGVVGYPRILRLCRCVSELLRSQIRR